MRALACSHKARCWTALTPELGGYICAPPNCALHEVHKGLGRPVVATARVTSKSALFHTNTVILSHNCPRLSHIKRTWPTMALLRTQARLSSIVYRRVFAVPDDPSLNRLTKTSMAPPRSHHSRGAFEFSSCNAA